MTKREIWKAVAQKNRIAAKIQKKWPLKTGPEHLTAIGSQFIQHLPNWNTKKTSVTWT